MHHQHLNSNSNVCEFSVRCAARWDVSVTPAGKSDGVSCPHIMSEYWVPLGSSELLACRQKVSDRVIRLIARHNLISLLNYEKNPSKIALRLFGRKFAFARKTQQS